MKYLLEYIMGWIIEYIMPLITITILFFFNCSRTGFMDSFS